MNAEARLLNAVCKNKDISTVLSADIDDMMQTHGDIWNWMRTFYFKHNSVPDAEILSEKFSDFDIIDTKAETEFYIDELRDEYLNSKAAEIIEGAARRHGTVPGSQLIEEMLQRVSVVAKENSVIRDISLTDFENAKDHYERKRELAIERDGAVGIRSGFKVMDAMYPTGMAGGHLVVVIGWSGHGKSWFQTLLACRAWEQGYRPMIISLEMSPEEVRDRAYTIMGSGLFKHSDFARGMIGIDSFDRWANKSLADKHDFIVVSSEGHSRVTPSTVQTKIDQHRPSIVFLDYQQLFDSDEQEGSEVVRNRKISREFKRIAVRNDLPVVNLTQATFDDPKDTDEPPRIEQVAWSKGIQQDADLALAVHKYTDSDMWAIIARKNRHGEEFAFGLDWQLNSGILKESI